MRRKWFVRCIALVVLATVLASVGRMALAQGVDQNTQGDGAATEGSAENPCETADKHLASGAYGQAQSAYAALNADEACVIEGLAAVATAQCADATKLLDEGSLNGAEQIYVDLGEVHSEAVCAEEGLVKVAKERCKLADTLAEEGDLVVAQEILSDTLSAYPNLQCALSGKIAIAKKSCTVADTLAEEGDLAGAEAIYRGLLGSYENLTCAQKGQVTVAKKRCGIAETQVAEGDLAGARETYDVLLAEYPDLACAVKGEATLGADFDAIDGSLTIGDYSNAWTALQDAAKKSPDSPEMAEYATQDWARSERLKSWWTAYGKPFLLMVIGILFFWLVARWFIRSGALKVDIDQIDFALEKLEDNQKAALTAAFEQSLVSVVTDSGLKNMKVIDSPLEAPKFNTSLAPSVTGAVNVLWDFMTKLFPANVVQVRAVLVYDEGKGKGIRVSLVNSRRKKLWDVYTIWESEISPTRSGGASSTDPYDYLHLFQPAAVKVYWIVYRRKHDIKPDAPIPDLRQVFGTDHSQSYIEQGAGVDLFKRGKLADAERLLRRALAYDHENVGALFNLGMVKAFEAGEQIAKKHGRGSALDLQKEYQDAVSFLNTAVAQSGVDRSSPAYIKAKYNLGIIELNKHLYDPGANSASSAIEPLQESVTSAEKTRAQSGSAITAELIATLQIALADAQQLAGQNVGTPVTEIEEKSYHAPSLLYNLACHFSTMVQHNKIPTARHAEALNRSLAYLEDTLNTDRRYAAGAEFDISLAEVRTNSATQARFEELIREASPPAPPIEPATLVFLVGDLEADWLKDEGIVSTDDLLRRASRKADRAKLAADSGVNDAVLLVAVQAAELVRVSDIELSMVQLLHQAKVASIADLAAYRGKADVLHDELKKAKTALKSPLAVPNVATLTWWIDQAKNTTSMVQT